MEIRVAPSDGYLRIVVQDREGAADARDALQQILALLQEASNRRVLILVRRSVALFKVDEYQLPDAILRAAGIPGVRIALVGDTPELFASYEYVELLARQKQLLAKAFRTEAEAVQWLRS